MKTKVFLTGLALLAVTVFANAQNPAGCKGNGNGPCNGSGKGSACIAKNNDGAEANKGNGNTITPRKNGNGNGLCDGSGKGQGQKFVDSNKDGICDNNKTGTKK